MKVYNVILLFVSLSIANMQIDMLYNGTVCRKVWGINMLKHELYKKFTCKHNLYTIDKVVVAKYTGDKHTV